jgi:hypothetical protein
MMTFQDLGPGEIDKAKMRLGTWLYKDSFPLEVRWNEAKYLPNRITVLSHTGFYDYDLKVVKAGAVRVHTEYLYRQPFQMDHAGPACDYSFNNARYMIPLLEYPSSCIYWTYMWLHTMEGLQSDPVFLMFPSEWLKNYYLWCSGYGESFLDGLKWSGRQPGEPLPATMDMHHGGDYQLAFKKV